MSDPYSLAGKAAMSGNKFDFQFTEEFLRGYAEYIKQLRETNPGKSYVVSFSVDLVLDGTVIKTASPPQIWVNEVTEQVAQPPARQAPAEEEFEDYRYW